MTGEYFEYELEKLLLTSNRTEADESKNILLLIFSGNNNIFYANILALTNILPESFIIKESSAFSDDRDFHKKLRRDSKIICMGMTTLNYSYIYIHI